MRKKVSEALQNTENHKLGVVIMILSAICSSVGQLLWKISADHGALALLFGFGFYGVGAILMIAAYRFGDASKLHPIQSLSYILAIIFGSTLLNESVDFGKVAGTLLILFGVYIVNSDPKPKNEGEAAT